MRDAITILAPRRAYSDAIALPSPVPAPVTNAGAGAADTAVADGDARHRRPDLHDDARHLVAEDGRRGDGQVAVEDGCFGVAHTAAVDAHHDVGGARGFDGDVLDDEGLTDAGEDGCSHGPMLAHQAQRV